MKKRKPLYQISRGVTSEGVSCIVLRPIKIMRKKEVTRDG